MISNLCQLLCVDIFGWLSILVNVWCGKVFMVSQLGRDIDACARVRAYESPVKNNFWPVWMIIRARRILYRYLFSIVSISFIVEK